MPTFSFIVQEPLSWCFATFPAQELRDAKYVNFHQLGDCDYECHIGLWIKQPIKQVHNELIQSDCGAWKYHNLHFYNDILEELNREK